MARACCCGDFGLTNRAALTGCNTTAARCRQHMLGCVREGAMDASVASRVIHGRTARRLCNRFCIGRIVRHENDSLDRFHVCLAPALHERLDVSGRHQPDIMPKEQSQVGAVRKWRQVCIGCLPLGGSGFPTRRSIQPCIRIWCNGYRPGYPIDVGMPKARPLACERFKHPARTENYWGNSLRIAA